MDPATQDMLHQRLNELLHDEEKIVTCLSVANEMKISSNDAKHLMETYVKDYGRIKSELLHVTYLLCGSLKENKGLVVYLVKENDLEAKKVLFDDISTEAIYSIQKSENVDFNMIALTNKGCEIVEGLITGQNCFARKNSMKLTVVQELPSTSVVKNSKDSTNKISHTVADKIKKDKSPKAKPTKQSGGIKSFFGKSQDKSLNTKKVENVEKSEPSVDKSVIVIKDESVSEEEMEVDVKENEEVLQKSECKSKKRKKSSKNDAPTKKRKRIQVMCDSDSDDMFDDESEDIIEKSDEEPPVQVTVKPTPPKNKRRKAVDKTYVDDEGFIVTNTEYIYESASDEENTVENVLVEPKVLVEKKSKDNKVEKKPAGSKGKAIKKPISGKQQTLMNFFKKA